MLSGCQCNNNVKDIIDKYITYGWIELTDIFKKNKVGKEKKLKKCVDDNLLKMLGSIRHYIVENLFKCSTQDKNMSYIAFGSTNITSDYDLTLTGDKSPQVLWKMFTLFLEKYHSTTTHAFDTNLYCIGLYSNKKSINFREKQKFSGEYFTIEPKNKVDKELCLVHAFMKLLGIKTKYKKVNKYLNKAHINSDFLDNMYHTNYKKVAKKYPHHNLYTKDLITKYKTYTDISKKLFNILYGKNKNTKDIIKYATMATYFAIEAYYTPCTVNVVVIEMQGGYNIKLSKINYICSIIENLGDMLHHIGSENNNNKEMVILKYSKYVYRIYYSIGKAFNNKSILKKAEKINSKIIPHRKTYDTSQVDYTLLGYQKGQTIKSYLRSFQSEVLEYIEELI